MVDRRPDTGEYFRNESEELCGRFRLQACWPKPLTRRDELAFRTTVDKSITLTTTPPEESALRNSVRLYLNMCGRAAGRRFYLL